MTFSPPPLPQNAINISRTLSEKVLTPPLVMFLAACMLHTVEQLHAVGIVHADIKPDNFMLGERRAQKTHTHKNRQSYIK